MNKSYIYIGLFFLLLFFVIFLFYIKQYPEGNQNQKLLRKDFTPKTIPNSNEDVIQNCQNLSVIETSFCLRDNIKTFYKESYSSYYVTPTVKRLKESGGDCEEYSELYSKLGKKLGFGSTTIGHDGVNGVFPPHQWAVLWDKEYYCKIDLLNVSCYTIVK